jgi:hypothetical protein
MPQQGSELSHHMWPVGVCQGAFREMLTSIIVAPSARLPVPWRTNRRRAAVAASDSSGCRLTAVAVQGGVITSR